MPDEAPSGASHRTGSLRTGPPSGEPALRTVAMPADTNPSGDIFGGWLMARMDLAAGVAAANHARGRVVTAAVSHMSFIQPVKVGDLVSCYATVLHTGRSSVTLAVEVWAGRRGQDESIKVTEAKFVLVAVDASGRPRPVPPVSGPADSFLPE